MFYAYESNDTDNNYDEKRRHDGKHKLDSNGEESDTESDTPESVEYV